MFDDIYGLIYWLLKRPIFCNISCYPKDHQKKTIKLIEKKGDGKGHPNSLNALNAHQWHIEKRFGVLNFFWLVA